MASTDTKWDSTFKRLAALLSGGAALVSILSFLAGRSSRPGTATITAGALAVAEVDRLELVPGEDTAFALGDTLRLTAMTADGRGVAVLPSRIQWQTDDSAVATVDSAGRVRARGPGETAVTVAAGGRMARARVLVLPRVTRLAITGDSVIRIAEGRSGRLRVEPRDARGNLVAAPGLGWTVADEAIATIDSSGELHALTAGSTLVSVTHADLLAQARLEVSAVPASMTLSAGAAQRAAQGERLPSLLVVQVVSRSGRPVPAVSVRFDAALGGGQVAPDSALSDSAGLVRTRWTLGPRPGRQQLLVSVPGIDSPLVASAEADPLATSTRITLPADSLSGRVLEPLAQPVVVQVTDTSGVVLADVPVAWKAMDGGEVVALSARSDSLGLARARWTLGPRAGRQRLQVQVGNPRLMPPRIVSAEARPAPAVRLSVVGGDRQQGTVGRPLPREVVLAVSDSLGNPVADTPVTFQRSGRAAEDTLIRSGKDGRVRLRWVLPRGAGADGLTARLPGGGDSVRLTARARPAAVDTIRFVSSPATAVAGRALAKPVEVRVVDRFGNPVPGAAVSFTATAGRLGSARAVADSHGVAGVRWTPGARAGTQTLSATVAGVAVRARQAVQVSAPPARRAAPPAASAAPVSPAKPAARPATAPARTPFGT